MREFPITGSMGVELTGIDLSQPISDDLAGTLRDALDRHLLVVFRDQQLTTDRFYDLARAFGEPFTNPYGSGPDEHPEMTHVIKEADETNGVFGGGWHTDLSFNENPPNGTTLMALEVPPYGGDTVWANQRRAWELLPEPLKALLDGRDAFHVGKPYGIKWAPPLEEQSMKGRTKRGDPEADKERAHPAVLTNPRTGVKSLYLNPTYVLRLDGMSEEESRPILEQVYRFATLPDFCCRLRWAPGTIAVWDNYATQHYAIDDYQGFRREMRRITFQSSPIAEWRS